MFDTYVEDGLYSLLDCDTIVVSLPSGTGKYMSAPLEFGDVKPPWRKETHETASSCSAWLWHRRPVAG